jgi:hypothetical protein
MPERQQDNQVYYVVSGDFTNEEPKGWKIANYDTLRRGGPGLRGTGLWPDAAIPWPDAKHLPPGRVQLRGPWNFPEYAERPRIIIDPALGRAPSDIEGVDFSLISAAAKAVIEAVDPPACDYRPCETVFASGEPGPELWLCTVSQVFIGAIDEAKSEGLQPRTSITGTTSYGVRPIHKIWLHAELLKSAHLFRLFEIHNRPVCDETFRRACAEAGLTGILFNPL